MRDIDVAFVLMIILVAICTISIAVFMDAQHDKLESQLNETLEIVADLKADITTLQAALEAHDTKPLWWEAE